MDNLAFAPITMALSKAGLAVGTTSTYTTANAVNYAIRSKAYTKAAVTNSATPTLDGARNVAFTPLQPGQTTVLVFSYNGAGTVFVTQGEVTNGNSPQFPVILDMQCPFGYIVVTTGANSVAWTPLTSNWNATGVTTAVQDIVGIPDHPQSS